VLGSNANDVFSSRSVADLKNPVWGREMAILGILGKRIMSPAPPGWLYKVTEHHGRLYVCVGRADQ